MAQNKLIVRGAREHNLKDITVEIPRDQLVVITGLSGSGKSSLAFDTIYAEGQRRYVESLSAYARQFLGLMEKPDVDQIEGLSPAISIDQKGSSRNPRSTVGTVTEIYDYLRLLFARIGQPHCPNCGQPISRQTTEQIVDAILEYPERSRLLVLAPLIKDRKGEHKAVFEDIRKAGFVRVRVDGEIRDTLSTHVAVDQGADLVISSYSIQPYHYNEDIGSLHEYGMPVISNQALYQVVQQKIINHIRQNRRMRDLMNAVNGYLKEINLPDEQRDKLMEILKTRSDYNPDVDYLYIHPKHEDYEFFFADHFSLNPEILAKIVKTGFRAAMQTLRRHQI